MSKYGIIAAVVAVALCAVFAASSCANNNKKKGNVQTMNRFDVTLLESSAANGVKKASFEPHGVCSTRIDIEVEGNIIKSVKFTSGCPGNTHGVANLVAGMTVEDAIKRLEGIDCGGKGTSCPDQLARALKYFL